MQISAPVLASLLIFSAVQIHADEPVPTATAQQDAAATKALASEATTATETKVAAVTPTPAAAPAAPAVTEPSEAQIKHYRGMGYKPVKQHNGTMLYCREETQLGSHFSQQICASADELERRLKAGQENAHALLNGQSLGTHN